MTYQAPPHPVAAVFAAQVTQAIRDRGLSAHQAAKACGVSPTCVYRVMRGTAVSYVTAVLIARGLGLSLDALKEAVP